MRRKGTVIITSALLMLCMALPALAAYHHEGEKDSPNFLAQYPDKAGTKLDSCSLCHTGGRYEKKPGKWVSLGSCQWCHYTYGYNGEGNIIDTLNPYGLDYLIHGRNVSAIAAIEDTDSDADGYSNIVEIRANRYPGNTEDDPTKIPAPSVIYTKAQLEAMAQHTQFLLMNTSRSGDYYARYTGVVMWDLLLAAGILDSATGITVFAPDGWSNYYPLEQDPEPNLYHVKGTYPSAVYYYNEEADTALNPVDGWCDYSAPSCSGRKHLDPIVNPDGLKMILAIKREGRDLEPGVLGDDNKLAGEGPFRVVPPQKTPCPPDQASNASNQSVVWPYREDWDHNAGFATRSATIIRVEPLPEGTTDIDVLEAGWKYVEEGKIIIYGAIRSPAPPVPHIFANAREDSLVVAAGDPVSITLTLDPGSHAQQMADWWVAVHTSLDPPSAEWYSYVHPTGWTAGIQLCVQTQIFEISSPVEVLNMSLPKGEYIFYFALDDNADGAADATWFDSVEVRVQ